MNISLMFVFGGNFLIQNWTIALPVTVSIGELTSGVFNVIFLVRAEVKSCMVYNKTEILILKQSSKI